MLHIWWWQSWTMVVRVLWLLSLSPASALFSFTAKSTVSTNNCSGRRAQVYVYVLTKPPSSFDRWIWELDGKLWIWPNILSWTIAHWYKCIALSLIVSSIALHIVSNFSSLSMMLLVHSNGLETKYCELELCCFWQKVTWGQDWLTQTCHQYPLQCSMQDLALLFGICHFHQ